MSYHTLADLSPSQRPREKLLQRGPHNLSDLELLALLLRSGTAQVPVLEVAHNLLAHRSLAQLPHCSVQELQAFTGIGAAKASQLLASFELGKRIQMQPVLSYLSPQTVWQETQDIHSKQREYLLALYLDARHQLLSKHLLAVGSLNQTIVEARDVFMEAIKSPCASLILCHNHPSGDPTPSDADQAFTQLIAAAGDLLGITLLDHVIVSTQVFFSFREQKLL